VTKVEIETVPPETHNRHETKQRTEEKRRKESVIILDHKSLEKCRREIEDNGGQYNDSFLPHISHLMLHNWYLEGLWQAFIVGFNAEHIMTFPQLNF
jgi:hypothetical protein